MRTVAALFIGLTLACTTFAQSVPEIINFQGRLLDGTNLVSADVGLALRLYTNASPTGGETVLYEDSNTVTVIDGLYATYIGDDTVVGSLRDALLKGAVYVGVEVNGLTLSPREQLTSVAYALLPGVRGTNNLELAEWSTIGGGRDNLISNLSENATIAGGYSNIIGYWSEEALISGGVGNRIGDLADGAVISGGSNNKIEYGAYWSTIVGGRDSRISTNARYNAIAGGENHRIDVGTEDAFIGGGINNSIGPGATGSAIGGGRYNDIGASATDATIAGGTGHEASGVRATIPGGGHAKADHYGQFAYASGRFAEDGDAQTSIYVLRNTSSGDSTVELFLDGLGQRLTIAGGRTVTFEGLVAARDTGGQSAGFTIRGVIENVGGTTTFVGPTDVTPIGEDEPLWDVTLTADDTNDALGISVTCTVPGSASTRWVATVRTTELQY